MFDDIIGKQKKKSPKPSKNEKITFEKWNDFIARNGQKPAQPDKYESHKSVSKGVKWTT